MIKEKSLSLFLGLLLLAGCTIPNQSRYTISAPGRAGAPVAADKESVKEVLQTVASQLKMKDMTASSLAPNLIVYYQQIDSNYPVKLMAWTEGDKIVIELSHWPETIGEGMSYRNSREYIESELKTRFGDRSSIVAFRNLAAHTTNHH